MCGGMALEMKPREMREDSRIIVNFWQTIQKPQNNLYWFFFPSNMSRSMH